MLKGLHLRTSHRGSDKPSDVNIVLNCLFDLVTLESELSALSFVLCKRLKQHNKAQRTKNNFAPNADGTTSL